MANPFVPSNVRITDWISEEDPTSVRVDWDVHGLMSSTLGTYYKIYVSDNDSLYTFKANANVAFHTLDTKATEYWVKVSCVTPFQNLGESEKSFSCRIPPRTRITPPPPVAGLYVLYDEIPMTRIGRVSHGRYAPGTLALFINGLMQIKEEDFLETNPAIGEYAYNGEVEADNKHVAQYGLSS